MQGTSDACKGDVQSKAALSLGQRVHEMGMAFEDPKASGRIMDFSHPIPHQAQNQLEDKLQRHASSKEGLHKRSFFFPRGLGMRLANRDLRTIPHGSLGPRTLGPVDPGLQTLASAVKFARRDFGQKWRQQKVTASSEQGLRVSLFGKDDGIIQHVPFYQLKGTR